ncbi:MAG: DUF4255 domain-containing protein [Bacteroidota bacterium]
MIDNALNTIRTQLNTYFKNLGEAPDDKVVYIDSSQPDDARFPLNKVSLALINIEEDRTLRQSDQWAGTLHNGVVVGKNPDVRIQLLLLFVARFTNYEQAMKSLSQIIRFFQAHRVFTATEAPTLDADIDRLLMELQTMPIAQQNELWNAMRSSYHPSMAYKLSLLTYRDNMHMELGGQVVEIQRSLQEFTQPQ